VLFRLILAASLALSLRADDRWTAVKYGPFQVYTNGSDRAAREKLMYLEQFREALRVITGKQELEPVWPVRVLVFKNARQMPAATAHFALGRNARMEAVAESGAFSRDSLKELARILLYDNVNKLPQPIEDGLIELMSTLEVDGTRVTLGAPVPEAERSHGWALMQLVTVNPAYSGRSRVMISNLEQSGDFEAASRNAFEKTAAEMNQQADAYLKAGNFATGPVSGRAVSMQRDFKPVQLEADAGEVALADLALANGGSGAEQAYTRLHGAAAAEGLGLLALKQRKNNEARRLFESAIASGSESARAWLEAARLEPDGVKARADLKKASELNPRWAEPYAQMAELDKSTPEQRAADLKKAAALEARNIDYWQALARAQAAARNFAEAQKAWAGAERAAANDEERARIHQVRLQVEQERADYEASERKRIADEREQDIQRVKSQSDAAIHAAEEEARKRLNPEGTAAPKNAVWMDELKGNAAADGVFERLDCIGTQARMSIKTGDGKTVQLLIRDPSQIVLSGGGEKTFGCGVQRGARRVHVEYDAKPDAKLKTTGEVTSIEFR
jgi:tetratricopeptide (TPR) repeat protein